HRRRFANKNKKGGLKGVVGVVNVAEDTPADTAHHRAVTPQQRLERGFVAPGDEMLQQLTVRPLLSHRLKDDAAEMMQQAIAVPHRRGGGPAPPGSRLPIYWRRQGGRVELFLAQELCSSGNTSDDKPASRICSVSFFTAAKR